MARPTIMTPEILKKLEEAFMMGCSDLEACFWADIGKTTLYNYQNDHPEFVERKEEMKKRPSFLARQTVVKEVQTDGALALKYLERKESDEFSTNSTLNTNLTFTQMPAIELLGTDELGKPTKTALTFNIGEKL